MGPGRPRGQPPPRSSALSGPSQHGPVAEDHHARPALTRGHCHRSDVARPRRGDHLVGTAGPRRVEGAVAKLDTGAVEKLALVENLDLGASRAGTEPDVNPDDLCFLQYTSGSTSAPKGVRVTHANLAGYVEQMNPVIGQRIESLRGRESVSVYPFVKSLTLDIATRVHNHNWRIDPIVRSMLDTDFYKLLMLQMIWRKHRDVPVTFGIVNRTANIRRLKQRVEAVKRKQAIQSSSETINGVLIEQNPDVMRTQIKFNGKPPQTIIDMLKSSGFRWSTTEERWQRLIGNGALYAAREIAKKCEAKS